MADKEPKDRSDAMEHDLHRLEDHIADAEKKLEDRRAEADPVAAELGGMGDQPDPGSASDVATEVESAQPGGDQTDSAD